MSDFKISVYNSDMLLLESYSIYDLAPINTPDGANDGAFRGIMRNTADISHFEISGYALVADDLAFTTSAPVPVPTTILLFVTGLIGLAGISKTKFFKKQ